MKLEKVMRVGKEIASNVFLAENLAINTVGVLFGATFPLFNTVQKTKFRNHYLNKWVRGNAWWLQKMIGTKIEVQGIDKIPKDASFIILSDHHSPCDIAVLFYLFQHAPPRFTASAHLFNIPFLGWSMAALDHIPVRRGDNRPSKNWVVSLAEYFHGKSKVLDALSSKLSGVSMEEFKERMIGRPMETARQRDLKAVQSAVQHLQDEGIPFSYVVFAPGTRWQDYKRDKGQEISREKGYPVYETCLPPKFGAITELLKSIYELVDGIALTNIVYTYRGRERGLYNDTKRFRNIMQQKYEKVTVYIQWVPKSDIPEWHADKDPNVYYNEVKEWILKLWQEPDRRLTRYLKTGDFDGNGRDVDKMHTHDSYTHAVSPM